MKADRHLYVTRGDDPKVVEADDPATVQGVTLLVVAGGTISKEDAKKYGLSLSDGKVVVGGDEPAEEVEEAPEPKAKETKPAAKGKK